MRKFLFQAPTKKAKLFGSKSVGIAQKDQSRSLSFCYRQFPKAVRSNIVFGVIRKNDGGRSCGRGGTLWLFIVSVKHRPEDAIGQPYFDIRKADANNLFFYRTGSVRV